MYSPVRAQPHVRHLKQLTCHCLSKASRDWPCLISSPQPAQSGGEGRRGERKSRKRGNENAHMYDRNRQEHFEHLCIYHSPFMSLPFCSANLSSLLYLLLLSSSSLSPVVTVTLSLPDGATRTTWSSRPPSVFVGVFGSISLQLHTYKDAVFLQRSAGGLCNSRCSFVGEQTVLHAGWITKIWVS